MRNFFLTREQDKPFTSEHDWRVGGRFAHQELSAQPSGMSQSQLHLQVPLHYSGEAKVLCSIDLPGT